MPVADVRGQLLAFGVVGTIGFVVNAAVVYLARGQAGPYAAGLLAWLVAATVTWWLNRVWTFRSGGVAGAAAQWLRFLMANTVGFALYFITYAGLIAFSTLCARLPIVAVGAGSCAGMAANFVFSRELVFSRRRQ
jgi:putative flippase GtrA